jgi:uroporphyrin-3 C-methyltransferase
MGNQVNDKNEPDERPEEDKGEASQTPAPVSGADALSSDNDSAAESEQQPVTPGDTPAPRAAVHRKAESDVASSPGGRGVALLALILALGAAGFSGWLYIKQEARRQVLDEREQRLDQQVENIAGTAAEARRAIDEAIAAARNATLEVSQRLADERARTADMLQQQQANIDGVEAALRSQRQQLLEMSSTDRSDWSLAEAKYLLRLAYQRLLLAKDVESALALLGSADAILRELDDTALYPAREAIARDIAALRAVPEIDREGAWLTLQALAGRIDSLILFEIPELESERVAPAPDAGWRDRLQAGFRAALQKLSDYLVFRRRDEPYEALIDPQWEQLVRQNLRMQVAQAQAALLSGNQQLYDASIASTRRWLAEFFDFNEKDVEALDAQLADLAALEVSREFPDISPSLEAVKAVIDLKHAEGGG